MTDPKISVVLPVYNGGKYLELSVESVLRQTMKDFELLIVDDCSTDDSYNYLKLIDDKRIRLFKNEQNKGLFPNLNFLIKHASADIIKLWAQDDIMYDNCLEKTCFFHEKHPEIGFSYSDRRIIDGNGDLIVVKREDATPEIISTELHAEISFFCGSIAGNIANVAINKKVLDKVGLFREEMKISGDFEMWVRLAKDNPVGYIREPLIMLRDHVGQLSRNEKYFMNMLSEDIQSYNFLFSYLTSSLKEKGRKMLRKYKLQFYYTLMCKAFIKGNFKTAYYFYKTLSGFDNFFKISLAFFGGKFLHKRKFISQYTDNNHLFNS